MRVFVVGQWRGENALWDLQGVYDDESKAILACIEDNYFVGPITMNEALPSQRLKWPGCYYPKIEPKPSEGSTDISRSKI